MDIKQYVRFGVLSQSAGYETVLHFDGSLPGKIILLLEGKCRRKLQLGSRRCLYENYYALSFIGLEDHLVGFSRKGGVGAYPGAHFCLWDIKDFQYAVTIYPELARRVVLELSRHLRIYDAHGRSIGTEQEVELAEMDLGPPEDTLYDMLFDFSFSDTDEFPPSIVAKLGQKFALGEYLMRQGDKSYELYIIRSGKVDVQHRIGGKIEKIASLGKGEMVGEMAQFDGLPRSADVVATEDTEVLVFLPENFSLLFQLHQRWTVQLLQTLANRLEQRRKIFEEIDLKSIH